LGHIKIFNLGSFFLIFVAYIGKMQRLFTITFRINTPLRKDAPEQADFLGTSQIRKNSNLY
jgi:hypothetical protein